MAAVFGARSFGAMKLAYATFALVAAYLLGAVIAALTDVGTLSDAAVNGTKLSAPSFMLVIEVLAAVAFVRGRRAAVYPLLAMSGLSLVAAAFDGDVGHAGLSAGHVAWQGLEVALSAVVFALALAAVIRRPQRPAVA
jgi:hypothetical protein